MKTGPFLLGMTRGVVWSFWVLFMVPLVGAEEIKLAYEDVFGTLRRPAVPFDHEIHSESSAKGDCGRCHHVLDDKSGKSVYIEGEELGCGDCHGPIKENRRPALREAFHGSCTVCHRNLIKSKSPRSGPTTCGGCHKKE